MSANVSFPRLVRSEWIKLRTLRSTFWCSIAMILLGIAFAALQASGLASLKNDSRFAEAAKTIDWVAALLTSASAGTILVSLIAAVLGVLMISGEFGSGMIRSTFAAAPTRMPALLAKAVVVAVTVFVVAFVGLLLALLLAYAILSGAGVDAKLGDGRVWVGIVGAAVDIALLTLFAFGVGTLLRNTAAGIATALGVMLVLPIVVSLIGNLAHVTWLQNAAGFLPSNAGGQLYGFNGFAADVVTKDGITTLNAWAGGGVLLAWVVVLLALGAIITRRRDV